MSDQNEFMQKYGAKREFWDEGLKFRYKNKDLHEFTASIYGLDYKEYPPTALTSEAIYLQWCAQRSNMIPQKRGMKDFLQYIRERLAEAEEEEIPPDTEEGVEIGVVVLTILKNQVRKARDFDQPQENDELKPGEWCFIETSVESRVGVEVYIKFQGLMSRVLDQIVMGSTETKIKRGEIVKWLRAHGRYCNREASVNRWRCAYILPYSLVESFEIFALRTG